MSFFQSLLGSVGNAAVDWLSGGNAQKSGQPYYSTAGSTAGTQTPKSDDEYKRALYYGGIQQKNQQNTNLKFLDQSMPIFSAANASNVKTQAQGNLMNSYTNIAAGSPNNYKYWN